MDGISIKPRDVKARIDLWLQNNGHHPVVKGPELIISVLLTANEAYLGLSTPADNLTSWNGGAVHYRATQDLLSRAGHKLEEALEVLNIDLKDEVQALDRDLRAIVKSPACDIHVQALDLGAAPGGWTNLLLDKGLRVTAVDTGDLSPHLQNHPRLRFLKQNAFDLKLTGAFFDILTCDMSWDPLRTARLLVQLAPALKPWGHVVLTVKFMGGKPLSTIHQCLALLKQEFAFIRGRHLWHNREEVTLYLRRR